MAKKTKHDNNQQLRLLGLTAVLEEATTPYLIRTSTLIVSVAFLSFLVWTGFAKIKEVARTVGEIVPSGHIQVIQHLEGGIVDEILVEEDDLVNPGQVLLRIRGESIKADRARLVTRKNLLEQRHARLTAFLNDKTPSDPSHSDNAILSGMFLAQNDEIQVLKEQIVQKNEQISLLKREQATILKNLSIAKESFETQKKLYEERLVPQTNYLNALQEINARKGQLDAMVIQIRQAEQAVKEFEWRLQSQGSKSKDNVLQQLAVLEDDLAENKDLIEKLNQQISRLELKSPTYGLVKGLEIHTIGGIIPPGQSLMEIVPLGEELVAEVKVSPNDIGHIKTGDHVTVKVTTFDFSRYGSIDGTLTALSATTFTNPQGTPYYKGMIKLSKHYVGNDPEMNKVLPGMIVNADIITGEKSLLAYLLKPIHRSLNSAFIER
ncbi:type I secretion membrane fusion protein, HlyD family [Desulfocapsa sulfexigens DSM 10523]|uniref:Type I secretion membrane fusion protein, HlyD family n=1 Tax=Desulfocapsa sulfexigens (strain DSM 10523 / SB164P1) TaxID=1167006 RepID=M1PUN7_DESSD|nr:HlyD family type I secretion periplasmic adaptor subunit [Desulfocapsa sulfexigens]AGF80036.1 type I secretion membrane fusion protein, HlyD family [Desulfocapsa sulfexigens DSM 10523]